MSKQIYTSNLTLDFAAEMPLLVHEVWAEGGSEKYTASYEQKQIGTWEWWLKDRLGKLCGFGTGRTLTDAMHRLREKVKQQ